MSNGLNITLENATPLNVFLHETDSHVIQINGAGQSGTRNYNNLTNKPSINGVTISGDLSTSDLRIVSENTEAGWTSNPLYVPKCGELCIYTDTLAIKVGDGIVPIIDLPYICGDTSEIVDMLKRHTDNFVIHVSQEDRDRWDAKLNYITNGENLIFTRR